MKLECFRVSVQEKWALLVMTRPETLNVLDEKALLELKEILQFLKDEQVKAVLLTGEGKAFAAGADVAAMASMDPPAAQRFSELGNSIFQAMEDHPAVFIAAINGYALGGGCELALACDLRYASTKASFAQPEINLGIIPGFGGTQRLPKIIGPAKAKEWILTGRRFSAEQAFHAGLIAEMYEPDQLLPETKALATELATKSGPILHLAKQAIAASGTGVGANHGRNEARFFGQCFATHDGPEGLLAFVEKRDPNFVDG